jgi:hypothetical protein
MEDHATRRKIIREWMALPKDKRHTEEQVVTFAKKAAQQNDFHRSRRDPDHKFRHDPYQAKDVVTRRRSAVSWRFGLISDGGAGATPNCSRPCRLDGPVRPHGP